MTRIAVSILVFLAGCGTTGPSAYDKLSSECSHISADNLEGIVAIYELARDAGFSKETASAGVLASCDLDLAACFTCGEALVDFVYGG